MTELLTDSVDLEHTHIIENEQTNERFEALGKLAFFEGLTLLEEIESPYEVMRSYMKDRLIERDDAVDSIVDALDRSGVRLPNDDKPTATFAFLGPTGTGKTRLAEVLSEALNGGKRTLIKINCENFSQGHEVSTLTGSPPSYVGHDQEPLFSKRRVEGKKTVVLFDELEKGHLKLFNLMLEITGDGKITLNNGEEVSFRDAIIIITSNLGAKEMSEDMSKISLGFGGKKETADIGKLKQTALRKFKDFFSPEFINRFDEMIVFPPLSESGLGIVLDTHVDELNKQYERSLGTRITLSEHTRKHLVGIAQKEPHMGARPLMRAFKSDVQSVFGRYILADALPEGTDMHVFSREEVPEQYRPAGDSQYVFFTKHDENLRRYRQPIAIEEQPQKEEEVNAEWEEEFPIQD